MVWLSYKIDDDMVDEDRTILLREKTNMDVLGNIRLFINQRSPIMFTCAGHKHKQTHNTFLVTA